MGVPGLPVGGLGFGLKICVSLICRVSLTWYLSGTAGTSDLIGVGSWLRLNFFLVRSPFLWGVFQKVRGRHAKLNHDPEFFCFDALRPLEYNNSSNFMYAPCRLDMKARLTRGMEKQLTGDV